MAQTRAMPNPVFFWGAIASCAVIVIGGLGPWAKIGTLITLNGSDRDGGILIGIGVIAAVFLAVHYLAAELPTWPVIVVSALGVLGLVIVIADINDINQKSDLVGGSISLGWGIIADLIGSIAVGAAGLVMAIQAPGLRNASIGAGTASVATPTFVQRAAPASMPPAGWYPDPGGGPALRYWDGGRWTEHVHDPGSSTRPGANQ